MLVFVVSSAHLGPVVCCEQLVAVTLSPTPKRMGTLSATSLQAWTIWKVCIMLKEII